MVTFNVYGRVVTISLRLKIPCLHNYLISFNKFLGIMFPCIHRHDFINSCIINQNKTHSLKRELTTVRSYEAHIFLMLGVFRWRTRIVSDTDTCIINYIIFINMCVMSDVCVWVCASEIRNIWQFTVINKSTKA